MIKANKKTIDRSKKRVSRWRLSWRRICFTSERKHCRKRGGNAKKEPIA